MKSRSDAQPGRLGAAKCTCGRQSVTKMMKPAFSGTNKRDFEVSTSDPANHVKNIRGLLANRVLWTVALVMGLRAMALVALLTILPLYFDRELNLSPFSRGFHVGLLIAVGLVAKLLMGYLSDRWGRKQVLGFLLA